MNIIRSKRIEAERPNYALPKTSLLLKNVLKISVPAALETFLIGIIGMMDTIMVGQVGDAAISAVAITQQPVFITLAMSVGLNAGIIAIVSRKRGENNKEEANNYLRQAMVLGIICSVIITLISIILAKPFMKLAGAKSDTIVESTNYFRIVSSVLIFNYLRLIICSALRACGDTKTTLATNLSANLINIFLNYCLIGGNLGFPELGVSGAAIATAIGNTCAFIISVFAIYNRKKNFLSIKITDSWKLDKDHCYQIYKISSNAFVEQLFMRVGFFISAKIVNELGTEQVAINTITQSVISLGFNITDGFSIGVSGLVGKSLGEKDEGKAFAYGRISQICSFCLGVVMFSLAVIFRYELSGCFSKNSSTVTAAGDLLKLSAFVLFPQSLQWVTTGILRGAGDTKYTAKSSLLSVTFVRPILSYIICYPLGLGLLGSWIGMFIDQTIRFYLNNRRFASLKWVKIDI